MLKETLEYLKSKEIKHSSFYMKGFQYKSIQREWWTPRNEGTIYLGTNKMHKNPSFSPNFKPKTCFFQMPELNCTISKGHLRKIKMNSEKKDNVGKVCRSIFSENRSQELSSTVPTPTLKKVKDEILFEKQLLIRPTLTEHISKIRITKRKFKTLKNKGTENYCAWTEDEKGYDEFELSN